MSQPNDQDNEVVLAEEARQRADAERPSWHHARNFVLGRPCLSATILLFLCAAIATLFGLSPGDAWTILLIGLVLIGGVAFLRFLPGESDIKPKDWKVFGYVMLGALGFAVYQGIRGKDRAEFPAAPAQAQVDNVQAAATEDFWQRTVASLHMYRFDPPFDGEVLAGENYDTFRRQFLVATEEAERASSEHVDPDLTEMVQRHRGIDEHEIQIGDAMLSFATEQGLDVNQRSAGESIQIYEQLLTNLTDEQYKQLPREFQELLAQAIALEDVRYEQFHEIEVMQARLSERYPDCDFSLPQLNLESTVD